MQPARSSKRVVILGDSLAMPRPEENVHYEETYAYKLSQFIDGEIICRASRSNTTLKQSGQQSLYDNLAVFEPHVVIIQLGIVDCSPRLFGRKQAFVLSKLPDFLRSMIINIFSKHRLLLTKIRPKVYVSQNIFEQSIDLLFKKISSLGSKAICISIASTNDRNNRRSYHFDENIKRYNSILQNRCHQFSFEYLDFYTATSENSFLLDDGIHINSSGHDFLTARISDLLEIDAAENSGQP